MSAHPAEVVEVVARAMEAEAAALDMVTAAFGDASPGRIASAKLLRHRASAIRALLAIPGLSDLLAGRARVVPVVATEAMCAAHLCIVKEGSPLAGAIGKRIFEGRVDLRPWIYRTMIAASPYAAAQPGAGGGE